MAAYPSGQADAQIEIIGEVIKAAIMAVDLGVQKLQTQTVYLQEAQKELENLMQATQLGDITDWMQQQKDLYEEYYQELWQIKNAITYYEKVKDIIQKQALLLSEYKTAYAAIRQDPHFSNAELQHIYSVYSGILNQSIANINQLALVINAFVTQMDDGNRLHIIDATGARIDKNYADLQQFTQENVMISCQRAKDEADLNFVKSLYGIQ